MNDIDIDKIVGYWRETAAHDYDTMRGLFKIKRYSDALFYGHIVLEKILKALVVKNIGRHAPRVHDLARLAELTGVKLKTRQSALLKEVNNFNIAARYPDVKLRFYKKSTRRFADKYLTAIAELYDFLCQTLRQKK